MVISYGRLDFRCVHDNLNCGLDEFIVVVHWDYTITHIHNNNSMARSHGITGETCIYGILWFPSIF